jgi:tetratricopeptide (TPR) repeat protein
MSLLLEALKKAEKAKEEAQRRAKGEPAAPELRVEPEFPVREKPVLTRAELPDIRQPLEILTDEIAPRQPEETSQAQRFDEPQAADRATARKVFEAKFREPNPRLPFQIAIASLGVAAIGVVVYFWYQLRPPPPLVNLSPPRAAQQAAAPTPESRPAAATATAVPTAIPGLPPIAAAAAPTPAPAPRERPPREAAPVAPQPAPRVAPAPSPRAGPPPQLQPRLQPRLAETPITQTRQPPQVDPKVASGYAAYFAGDLATARADYQAALREDAGNRDALLGLAATDVRTGRYEGAEAAYLRLLQNDPTDAHAQAGLIALRASRLDPLATESRVKNLLAADPGANVLHFTLGNQLAQQGRWAEAQQEYFKAMATDPDNADFAFNLAVSLDHLRQSKLAADYYRRAIALAENRGASFDLAAARTRAAQLGN